MFDFDIEYTEAGKFKEALSRSEVRFNGRYIFSQIEFNGQSFQIIYPGRDILISDYFKELASKVISDIHRLNQTARANTPDSDHSLHYIRLSETEVELHYVNNLVNSSSGVFFKIEENGHFTFYDWG